MTIKIKHVTKMSELEQLSLQEQDKLQEVVKKFPFRSNDYYLSLIDWNDPNDPIRRIIVPNLGELESWGFLDPSNEQEYTVLPGLEHKYSSTVLLMVSNDCEGICRYCYRKRVFLDSEQKYLKDISGAMEYISEHPEVTNVLLSGADPLTLPTKELENIIKPLRQINHIQIIRIGTRVPSFNPYRIINDPSLLEMLNRYSMDNKKIYIMTHFIHPRELTNVAYTGITLLQNAGAIISNQFPLIRGVNDDSGVLAELLNKVSYVGITPYYIFQCRPTTGNKGYSVPIEEGYAIIEKPMRNLSGLAKRFRFVMAHTSGKVEIIGIRDGFVYLKFHRSANYENSEQFFIVKSNSKAYWLEDYQEILNQYLVSIPFQNQV